MTIGPSSASAPGRKGMTTVVRRRGIEHAEDPDREQARLLRPRRLAGVDDHVLRLVGDSFSASGHRAAPSSLAPRPRGRGAAPCARARKSKARARVVDEPAIALRNDTCRALASATAHGLGVDGGRRLPVREVEGVALLEEDRELAALGPEPEAVLAAVGVDVRLRLPRGHELAVDPAEAGSRRRRWSRSDPALRGREPSPRARPSRRPARHLGVLLQERDFVLEARARQREPRPSATTAPSERKADMPPRALPPGRPPAAPRPRAARGSRPGRRGG